MTGTVVLDVGTAKRDKMRARLGTLPMCPDGARVIVDVGAAAPAPEAVWLLAEHEARLQLDVHGTAHAVRQWIDALRSWVASGERTLV